MARGDKKRKKRKSADRDREDISDMEEEDGELSVTVRVLVLIIILLLLTSKTQSTRRSLRKGMISQMISIEINPKRKNTTVIPPKRFLPSKVSSLTTKPQVSVPS